jgi:hypothetical protein
MTTFGEMLGFVNLFQSMCTSGARLAVLLVLLSASAGADEPELNWCV